MNVIEAWTVSDLLFFVVALGASVLVIGSAGLATIYAWSRGHAAIMTTAVAALEVVVLVAAPALAWNDLQTILGQFGAFGSGALFFSPVLRVWSPFALALLGANAAMLVALRPAKGPRGP